MVAGGLGLGAGLAGGFGLGWAGLGWARRLAGWAGHLCPSAMFVHHSYVGWVGLMRVHRGHVHAAVLFRDASGSHGSVSWIGPDGTWILV